MAKLSMRHLYKVYPQGSVKAVSDFSMDIEDNEFIVFVGPSGCGKSTLLRMIAGLEEISAGEISIDGQIVNHIEPKDRDIAMVFQNYALYPHMTVFNNMAFGLQLKKMPEEEIKKRLDEAAEILDIKELLERKPKNMSGGQRQRVALGRAIVRNPKVFLLDEPLSNLDAKLRTQMRIEIIKLHEKLKSTFIYVTHDQVEAMTMGSRIVVLKDGFTQQIDTPQNLYNYPLNKFVAGFIGTPQMNFYDGAMEKVGDKIIFTIAGGATIEYNESLFERVMPEYLIGKKQVTLGIRPEDIYIGKKKQYPKASLACKVSVIEKLGSEVLLYGDSIFQGQENAEQEPCGITIKVDNKNDVQKDDVINFVFDPLRLHLFDAKSEKTILTRIPKVNHTKAIVSKDEITLFGQPFKLPKALKGQVADGEYIGAVASDAFIFSQKGVVVGKYEQEHWAGERLIKFYLEESPIFAVANEDDIIQAFDLDMKKISLLDAEGNTKLGSLIKTRPIAFMGGAVTIGAMKESIAERSFAQYLFRNAKKSNMQILGGEQPQDLCARVEPQSVVFFMAEVLDKDGNIVADSVDEYLQNIEAVLEELSSKDCYVILLTPYPVWTDTGLNDRVESYKDALLSSDFAEGEKIVALDLFEYFSDLAELNPSIIRNWTEKSGLPNYIGHFEIAKKLSDFCGLGVSSVTTVPGYTSQFTNASADSGKERDNLSAIVREDTTSKAVRLIDVSKILSSYPEAEFEFYIEMDGQSMEVFATDGIINQKHPFRGTYTFNALAKLGNKTVYFNPSVYVVTELGDITIGDGELPTELQPGKGKLAGWQIALIVIGGVLILALVGGLVFEKQLKELLVKLKKSGSKAKEQPKTEVEQDSIVQTLSGEPIEQEEAALDKKELANELESDKKEAVVSQVQAQKVSETVEIEQKITAEKQSIAPKAVEKKPAEKKPVPKQTAKQAVGQSAKPQEAKVTDTGQKEDAGKNKDII